MVVVWEGSMVSLDRRGSGGELEGRSQPRRVSLGTREGLISVLSVEVRWKRV